MGAGAYWIIKVLRAVEDEVEVHAVTKTEAMALAARQPGVITVLERPITDEDWRRAHDR